MRVGGARVNNCTFDVPGYGKQELSVTTLGYGLSIAATVGESRRQRTFYPFKKTSGVWYVEASFSDLIDRNDLHKWLIDYIQRATSQWEQEVMAPITVSVPSRDFIKTGYPISSVALGDSVGMAVYRTIISFTSASEPLDVTASSTYAPPTRDETARKFYPSGDQSHHLPDPIWPSSGAGGPDAVWSTGPLERRGPVI